MGLPGLEIFLYILFPLEDSLPVMIKYFSSGVGVGPVKAQWICFVFEHH